MSQMDVKFYVVFSGICNALSHFCQMGSRVKFLPNAYRVFSIKRRFIDGK